MPRSAAVGGRRRAGNCSTRSASSTPSELELCQSSVDDAARHTISRSQSSPATSAARAMRNVPARRGALARPDGGQRGRKFFRKIGQFERFVGERRAARPRSPRAPGPGRWRGRRARFGRARQAARDRRARRRRIACVSPRCEADSKPELGEELAPARRETRAACSTARSARSARTAPTALGVRQRAALARARRSGSKRGGASSSAASSSPAVRSTRTGRRAIDLDETARAMVSRAGHSSSRSGTRSTSTSASRSNGALRQADQLERGVRLGRGARGPGPRPH